MSKKYTTSKQIRGTDKAKRTLQKNDIYIMGMVIILCGAVMVISPYFPATWTRSPDTVFLTAGQFITLLGLTTVAFGGFFIVQRYRFRHLSIYQVD